MFSYLSIKSFDRLRRENSYKNIFRIFIILLTVIMLLFSFIIAVTSFYWDRGDYHPWGKSVVDYIKSDITKNGNEEEHVLVGITMKTNKIIDYQLYLGESEIDKYTIYPFFSLKHGSKYSGKQTIMDLERIDLLKPSYIIIDEDAYKIYFEDNVKRKIFNDYRIVFHSQNYAAGCFVLKRKDIQPPESSLPPDGKAGEISRDIFERTVPCMMKVGKPYTVLVQIKNTDDSRTNFTANLHSDKYIIFEETQEVILDKSSTYILKFEIVPIKEYVGELPITVDLYAKHEDGTHRKVDSVSDYVYLTKR